MMDIVENRKRIALGRKLKLAALVVRENGLLWCGLLLTYYVASKIAHQAFSAMDRMRRARGTPGLNSATLNKEIWEGWDWSAEGEEWNHSPQWKQSLIHCVLEAEIPPNIAILEIGPGGGRWTGSLLERASRYIGVDISSACVDHCRKKFGGDARATFVVGSGRDLAAVTDASIDAIWSFDAFVHINREEVECYTREFARVLKPGAVAVIHHGAVGGKQGGWRSNLTEAALRQILANQRLILERSFDRWNDGHAVHTLAFGDQISVIRRPPRSVDIADQVRAGRSHHDGGLPRVHPCCFGSRQLTDRREPSGVRTASPTHLQQ